MIRRTTGLLEGKEPLRLKGMEAETYYFYESRNKRRTRGYYIISLTAIMLVIALTLLALSFLYENNITPPDDSNGKDIPTFLEGILQPSKDSIQKPAEIDTEKEKDEESEIETDSVSKDIYAFDYTSVPEGETPIVPMDLSLVNYGNAYIHNSTGLSPDTPTLLNSPLDGLSGIEYISSSLPSVLIIHTHGTEAYCDSGAISYKEDPTGDIARSADTGKNVVAVGKTLCDALNKKGIYAVHCEIMHDAQGYRSSYDRAKETIEEYLGRYPSIKLVIDLHRDAVINSDGDIIRPIANVDGKIAAQMMCVVGSDYGGEENARWEENLSLALKLREELNDGALNLCRPVYLKSSTYNQEIAKYSLLLEIGSCGNSLDEAKLSAELVANALVEILK